MATKKTPQLNKDDILAKLGNAGKSSPPPVIQEVASASPLAVSPVVPETPVKRIGRKKHRLDDVEYARISAGVPVELKAAMSLAILTTHKDFPTIDTFVAEAIRVFMGYGKDCCVNE